MTSIGFSRTVSGAAAAAVIAGGILVTPAPGLGAVASATSVPVQLTGLFGEDSSLMDDIGQLTGLSGLLHILDDPNGPLFPFAIAAEGLGEIFVIMPLLLLVGVPLVLLTDGPSGVQQIFNDLTAVEAGVTAAFEGLKDWYATHNPFTGALLDPPAAEAAALSLTDPAAWTDALHGAAFTPDVPDAGGFDVAPLDLDPGDLTF